MENELLSVCIVFQIQESLSLLRSCMTDPPPQKKSHFTFSRPRVLLVHYDRTVNFELPYSLDGNPPPKSKPPVYNVFLTDKPSDDSRFSKVSPWVDSPDYRVLLTLDTTQKIM